MPWGVVCRGNLISASSLSSCWSWTFGTDPSVRGHIDVSVEASGALGPAVLHVETKQGLLPLRSCRQLCTETSFDLAIVVIT